MAQGQEITVRRAKVGDADRVAALINRALAGPATIAGATVIERLGSVGFMLAERGDDVVGMLGWQAENLVVRVTDFLIWSASDRVAIGRALLSRMEQAAAELQCEAVLLFLPHPAPTQVVEFCRPFGYEPWAVADLPGAWQEAAREAHLVDDEVVLVKQLRANRVIHPL